MKNELKRLVGVEVRVIGNNFRIKSRLAFWGVRFQVAMPNINVHFSEADVSNVSFKKKTITLK